MTNQQLKVLHIHRRKLEEGSGGHFTRADFDLILMNIGNVRPDGDGAISSKSLTNTRFERVMAFLEDCLAKVDGRTGSYWRDRDARFHSGLLTSRQEWEIHRLFEQLITGGVTYQLAGLVHEQSHGRTARIDELSAVEAVALIELLKNVGERQGKTALDPQRKHVPAVRRQVTEIRGDRQPSLFGGRR